MPAHDIRETNRVVRQLIERTQNPRHRFMLLAFDRHRNLEMAGRYEELFAPDMMVAAPVYHINAHGVALTLEGAEAIKRLYRMWSATNQAVFYVESEQIAVADGFVASVAVGVQQISRRALVYDRVLPYLPRFLSRRLVARALARETHAADDDAMYLYRNTFQMIWPYDERGRLRGEDIYEPDPAKAEIVKLDRADVLTTGEAARLLAPLIKPLPSFDEMVAGSGTTRPA